MPRPWAKMSAFSYTALINFTPYPLLMLHPLLILHLMALMLGLSGTACAPTPPEAATTPPASARTSDDFGAYWFTGEAELNSYSLTQARYGAQHEGHAVLIFVTEDFSRTKQVKLDHGPAAGADRVPILKLNLTKNFLTGIYPYSLMTSVFSPLDRARDSYPLKVTATAQEWCGHVFTQLNLRENAYHMQGFSYFETEGDSEGQLPLTYLEDGFWTHIRLDPASLPQGEAQVIPGIMDSRLRHRDLQAQMADLSLNTEGSLSHYRIHYPATGRSLTIHFEAAFPHVITGWEEVTGGLTTQATRRQTIRSPYWEKHQPGDTTLRRTLGL